MARHVFLRICMCVTLSIFFLISHKIFHLWLQLQYLRWVGYLQINIRITWRFSSIEIRYFSTSLRCTKSYFIIHSIHVHMLLLASFPHYPACIKISIKILSCYCWCWPIIISLEKICLYVTLLQTCKFGFLITFASSIHFVHTYAVRDGYVCYYCCIFYLCTGTSRYVAAERTWAFKEYSKTHFLNQGARNFIFVALHCFISFWVYAQMLMGKDP